VHEKEVLEKSLNPGQIVTGGWGKYGVLLFVFVRNIITRTGQG
jgi:hypothetical protein